MATKTRKAHEIHQSSGFRGGRSVKSERTGPGLYSLHELKNPGVVEGRQWFVMCGWPTGRLRPSSCLDGEREKVILSCFFVSSLGKE